MQAQQKTLTEALDGLEYFRVYDAWRLYRQAPQGVSYAEFYKALKADGRFEVRKRYFIRILKIKQ